MRKSKRELLARGGIPWLQESVRRPKQRRDEFLEKTKILESLTPEQAGLKDYLERSSKNSLGQSELKSLLEGSLKEEKDRKKKDTIATIGGIFIFVILVAIVIGIIV